MRTPSFWYRNTGPFHRLCGFLLSPLSNLYGQCHQARTSSTTPVDLSIPIFCIGNLILGGAGKTPTAIAIATQMKELGLNVHFLSRGYGGALKGPLKVDPQIHSSRQVGDEPLLLSQTAPTWISRDRVQGAKKAMEAGADVIVMDDGFQNNSLQKDCSFVVIDGLNGFGNMRLFPAGPLREPLQEGLKRAQVAVIVGEDKQNVQQYLKRNHPDLPILEAILVPELAKTPACFPKKFIGFAGIAFPKKFFKTLESLGGKVVETHSYSDHHQYRKRELSFLKKRSRKEKACLITTEKDFFRLPKKHQKGIFPLPIRLEWKSISQRKWLKELILSYENETASEN
ncbi:MAG: tetraacyldisaccharide 4'-kinase [Alphaproteobacteria bacterium]|jgi:tetraacyldisaccharide 4'-kinase|nr:tetraacyldisaccharide 4'-kinase [Alphaproteobacteria bacterium]MBT5389509.1 tetraacyldisaccharide 4'-kinase [Alphaproteobacteria bacterium]MBT5541164.1 tetraacyldisaccharide 4'-kinase [Alphaproteobacteria bacterium]